MFRAHCPAERREVLLSPRRITAIRTSPSRVEIDFTCWCGARGTVVDHRGAGRHPSALLRPEAA